MNFLLFDLKFLSFSSTSNKSNEFSFYQLINISKNCIEKQENEL
jgi:hypothetical protein